MNRSLKISSVVQARLAQEGECWTWNQRSRDSRLTGSEILLLEFFVFSKAYDVNIGIIANFV